MTATAAPIVPSSAAQVYDAVREGVRVVYAGSLVSMIGAEVYTAHGCGCTDCEDYGPRGDHRLVVEVVHAAGRAYGMFTLDHVRPGSFYIHPDQAPNYRTRAV